MLPIIAIVGRPNVGKSTLFNRLTKTRSAIVGNVAGLTRDRQYGTATFNDQTFIVVDTGGVGEVTNEIETLVQKQAKQATQEASAIIFLVDGRAGITEADKTIANDLRKLNKPVYLTVNKIDGLDTKIALAEFYSLGLGEPIPVAAEHNLGIAELLTQIMFKLPEAISFVEKSSAIKIAFVGRPNVGKSTLINRILGEERVITFNQPGTTRDSIFIDFKRQEQEYILIDTAGVRRRGKITDAIEKFSVIKALQAIEAANVVILVIDAQENITEQDLKLLGFILDAGRALVIAVNKWDNLETAQREKIKSELDRRLTFVDFAEIHFISALHGTGVGNLFAAINKAYQSATKDLKTANVTEILEQAVAGFQPPLVRGKRPHLRYAHVGGHNPPLFIIHGSYLSGLPENYRRYLERYFRNALKLTGTPVRIKFI